VTGETLSGVSIENDFSSWPSARRSSGPSGLRCRPSSFQEIRMAHCSFCGSPAEYCCSWPTALKRFRVPAAQVVASDNIVFRPTARRIWKVLRVYRPGVVVALDLECRVRRFIRVWAQSSAVTVIRPGPCNAPCCYRHARDLGGRHRCEEHW